MPPSQLKRLKASLREQGIVGPQKSKKQKKQASQRGAVKDKNVQRNAALQGIREQFNPFEVKVPSRGNKYQFTNGGSNDRRAAKGIIGRPGVSKGLGEENRRKTLLVEMQRRKKVGGIMDRRFGEADPTMTPEEKALERFVKEKQRGNKKSSTFDLEGDESDVDGLTHMGQSLSFELSKKVDDFKEVDIGIEDEDEDDNALGDTDRPRKRRRLSDSGSPGKFLSENGHERSPDRMKSRQEVMKEVVAKSKLHKYERQKTKEDDDDLRAELDQGLSDIYALIRDKKPNHVPKQSVAVEEPDFGMNPDRAALLKGKDRSQADREYDERLRQMAFDQRSKPTVRTKTEDERFAEEAERLKQLEEKRIQRMRGEDANSEAEDGAPDSDLDEDGQVDIKENFAGLGKSIAAQNERKQLDIEDEDDFLIEDDLIASASDVNDSEYENQSSNSTANKSEDDEDKEFVQGLLSRDDLGREGLDQLKNEVVSPTANRQPPLVAYTYPCPQSHEEFLLVAQDVSIYDLPTMIQRIRALYHPRLDSGNKVKLGIFSAVLVDHISFLANQSTHPPFRVMETLIRHIHSLAKSFPEEVGRAFRSHLKSLYETRPTAPTPGDLILFTATASIFPTSDHFHPVVTPAILSMARYLGQKIPRTLGDLAKGAYIGTLCLQYQRLSKRYIPELVNYTLYALSLLAPFKQNDTQVPFPWHGSVESLHVGDSFDAPAANSRPIQFWDIAHSDGASAELDEELKVALVAVYVALVDAMAELWIGMSAFYEIFQGFSELLRHFPSKNSFKKLSPTNQEQITKTNRKLQVLLQQAILSRRPLLLHNHRPLAIKTSIPKFEESYNPDKHYDPDRDRADLSKLQAEHKRERKGAMRELRKDANFIARESLREKKERDAAYEKKYKRLVAEIQGEEGREAKVYEREKRLRKGKR